MNIKTENTQQIDQALSNVLSDEKFLASPQMSAFLSYVVNETVAGNASRIKAYTVAVDALGKPTSFDPQNDPSVRVLANRLRSSLKRFYTDNPEQDLFIELYRGSYVPHFIDPEGNEHIHEVKIEETVKANTGVLHSYSGEERPFANHRPVRPAAQAHTASVMSIKPENRVNLWLNNGGKKLAES